MNGQETEVKFYVEDLLKVKAGLVKMDAHLIQPRVHEVNLRFDTPERTLKKEGKVLRLRQDQSAKMTFKSGAIAQDGILSRREIEFEVANFEAAQELITSLGYEVILLYEKYRTTYELHDLHIMLDELPYGDFVEIEGEQAHSIRDMARQMGLNWSAAITASYSALFERVAIPRKLNVSSLTFEAFGGQRPTAKDLSVEKAD